jgi:hypothetical protein
VAGQRRYQQHARLCDVCILAKVQQRPEWRDLRRLFVDSDLTPGHRHRVDAKSRAAMRQFGARDELASGAQMTHGARRPGIPDAQYGG